MDFASVVEDRISGINNISDLDSLSKRLSTIQTTNKRFSDETYERLLDSIYHKKSEMTLKGV